METCNRTSGKVYLGIQVREEGLYCHSEKHTITMAISCDIIGEHWVDIDQKGGATVIGTVMILYYEY